MPEPTKFRCWYTKVACLDATPDFHKKGQSEIEVYQAYTVEHLIPVKEKLHLDVLEKAWQWKRNTVPATMLANTAVGSSPLGVKLIVRQTLRESFWGIENFRNMDMVKTIKGVISDIIKVQFSVRGVAVWDEGIEKIPGVGEFHIFGLNNPKRNWTKTDLDERAVKLRQIAEVERPFLKDVFRVDIMDGF